MTRHVEGLTASIEQSRVERERQEARCREFGESAAEVKARLVELQEEQAQDMAAAHQLDVGLEDVRRAVSSLRESRMAVEVKKAEIRMQLGTVESTLLGTYQVDLATLLESPVVEMTPEQLSIGEESIPEGQRQSMKSRYGSNCRRFARSSIAWDRSIWLPFTNIKSWMNGIDS